MTVEVWTDLICPWCYVGHHQLLDALDRFEHRDEVDLAFRAFELQPRASVTPDRTVAEWMAARGAPRQRVEQSWAVLRALAEAQGLEIELAEVRPVRTFDAHRLI